MIAAGRCDAKLRMPQAPLPKIEELAITAQWLGQDGSNPTRPGDVHVVLGGLPGSARIVGDRPERHGARGLAVSRQRSGPGAARRAAGLARRPDSAPIARRPTSTSHPIATPVSEMFSVRVVADGRPDLAWPVPRRRLRPDPAGADARALACRGPAGRRPPGSSRPQRHGRPHEGDVPAQASPCAQPPGHAHRPPAVRRCSSARMRMIRPGRRPSRCVAATRRSRDSPCASRARSAGTGTSPTDRP